ncbi:unnamed protein product [Sphenostylis stenocarpa]|uniref:Gnk2-homologous domain-containing protein n=1 Tax=Sphenostylis stenocarpa TaxID=92480 RepID=A0AA86W2K5_9FABA|nr:unnamed protein product [Sphenostylis stenocarpa]
MNSSMAWYLKYVIPFIFFISLNFTATRAQGLSYEYQVCSANHFTPNSTFQRHLTTLFSSLSSKASSNVQFFNNTVTGTNSSETVYGLFMCRGDIPSDICNNCVGNATQRLSTHPDCILSKAAVVYYDECIVRYSNLSFFSSLTMLAGYVLPNPTNMTNQESFKALLYDTMNKTADDAADYPTGAKKFATTETNIDIFQKLYCLAQCTQDLSPGDCRIYFGMARIVDIDQNRTETDRIVGTYGYMAPEYAMLGQFSEKSDVFSFGIMILEIISGKKNANSYVSHHVDEGLMTNVWRNWTDQTPLSIVDPNMKENDYESEVIRCIEIGLLCVQENPNVRPTIGEVVSYLNDLTLELPSPQEPAFFSHGINEKEAMQQGSRSIPFSVNDMSITDFYPR